MILKTMTVLGMLLAALTSHARDPLVLGQPQLGGNGCPVGSAAVSVSPDQSSVSILFDQYIVEAGGANPNIARKSCNIAVPVKIPQGYSVSVFQVDYRGYVFTPRGGSARFSAEYFFAGSRGPVLTQNFSGGTDREYIFTNNLIGEALVWSSCGADTHLRANTSMMVRSNGRGDEALATVDSADISSGIIYHIQWKRCHN